MGVIDSVLGSGKVTIDHVVIFDWKSAVKLIIAVALVTFLLKKL
jgi:hypothetical protein